MMIPVLVKKKFLNNLITATSKGSLRLANRTDNSQFLQFPINNVTKTQIATATDLNYFTSVNVTTPDVNRPKIGAIMFNTATLEDATELYISLSGSFSTTGAGLPDYGAFWQGYIDSGSVPGFDNGFIRIQGGLQNNPGYLEWEVTGYGQDSSNPTYGAVGMVTASLGTRRSSSGANPFNQLERVTLQVIPTSSGGMV